MSPDASPRLSFDAAKCDGWGMCTVIFPEGISLDPWGFAHVTEDPITDPRLRRKARRAVACCPRGAIDLVPGQLAPPTPSGRHESE